MKGPQEANWYKPEPAQPYRPLIAMPRRVTQIEPWLSYCTEVLFTAYDPPSALRVEKALVPPIPPSKSNAHSSALAPSPTMDPKARQKVSVKASIPVPASIATVDQPKATSNPGPAPKEEGIDPGSQPNDPTTPENAPLQPGVNTVEPNGDPKGVNEPQQNNHPEQGSESGQAIVPNQVNSPQEPSDPYQSSDPKQTSGDNGSSGQKVDPKADSDPSPVNNSQGSHQNADTVPQNDPEQIDNAKSFNEFIEGQTKTLNDQVIQSLSHGISITSTTLTPGAPPITVSDTPIHFDSSALVVGTSTVPLAPEVPTQIITTIAGQGITAALNAIAIAGITLRPEAPGMTLDGTLLSLDTASQLIIGSQTIPLESASPNSITTTIGGQIITASPDKIAIEGTALTPGASVVTINGTLISLDPAGQLIVGSKTITLQSNFIGLDEPITNGFDVGAASEVADPITTTVDGQVITAGPTALAMAGTTLTLGASGFTINGTIVSLNPAAQLVIGSKTLPLKSQNAGSSGETAGLRGLILGGFGASGPFSPFSTNASASTRGNPSTAAGKSKGTGVQVFRGNAANLEGSFGGSMAVSVLGMAFIGYSL